jgi:hypothetical protein
VQEADLREAQNAAAKASLAGIGTAPFGLSADSHDTKLQQATERQAQLFTTFSNMLLPIILLVPLAGALAMGFALWREQVLGRSLAVGMGLPLLALCWFVAVLFTVPMPGAPWADSPLDKLSYLIEELGPALLCLIAPIVLGGILGGLGLGVRSVRKAELSLGIALLTLAAYAILLFLFVVVLIEASPPEPSPWLIAAFSIAYLALPLAFGARAVGYGFQRQGWELAAAGLVAGLALFMVAGPLAVAMAAQPLTAGGVMDVAPEGQMFAVEKEVAFDAVRAEMPMATPAPEPAMEMKQTAGEGHTTQQQDAPLLRQFFPETMYWNPTAVTDRNGGWRTETDLAHTITTWRLSALASSQDGRLGSATAPIRVFQDFFVDIDLPLALTQGDEVSMPVAVYNYLEADQQVQLTLEEQDWFASLGEGTQTVDRNRRALPPHRDRHRRKDERCNHPTP